MCDHCGCRAYPPIAELTADHEEILRRAWELAETERAGAPVGPGERDELLAVLDVHVTKEETGLYPELAARGDLTDEQRAQLDGEHREIREALTGGRFDRRAFYALAAHIEDEEMELVPAAMFGFDDDGWEAMDAAHHRARGHSAVLPR